MMGQRQVDQAALFYEFSLERQVPATHLLRSIDRFVDLSDIRSHLAPFYSCIGRPSIDPELLVRMADRFWSSGWSSAEKAPGGDQVLFAGQNLPPSHSQVDRSLSILRVQDVGFHSGQSLLHGFKIEAGARELGGLRILLL